MAASSSGSHGEHSGDHPSGHSASAAATPPPAAATPPVEETQEQKDARLVSSIGAQVILDFNGDGSRGARGGAAATIEGNIAIRDAHLLSLGLVPHAPSGPPPGEPPPEAVPAAAPPGPKIAPEATKVSSLAAGILADAPATGGPKPAPARK